MSEEAPEAEETTPHVSWNDQIIPMRRRDWEAIETKFRKINEELKRQKDAHEKFERDVRKAFEGMARRH